MHLGRQESGLNRQYRRTSVEMCGRLYTLYKKVFSETNQNRFLSIRKPIWISRLIPETGHFFQKSLAVSDFTTI